MGWGRRKTAIVVAAAVAIIVAKFAYSSGVFVTCPVDGVAPPKGEYVTYNDWGWLKLRYGAAVANHCWPNHG